MKVNITKMGDGYVVTENDETQSTFSDMESMQQYVGSILISPLICDKLVIQLDVTIESEEFTFKNAKPVAPKPYEV